MIAMAGRLLVLLQLFGFLLGDVFFHIPRGSNDRLNGQRRERLNGNRLFDSQNNARGGYNVGSDGRMHYYEGSILPIEWTNQHSCSDQNNNCELIIQYMCGPNVRDGTIVSTIPENNWSCLRRNCSTDQRFGMHEDISHYLKCKTRERNLNLFTADQKLKRNTAQYTRQNPQGQRRGLECPEERDYYPYWEPSPWKDIVIMTSDTSKCDYYKEESQNVKHRFECQLPMIALQNLANSRKIIPNNREACMKFGFGAKWVRVPAHGIEPPQCIQAPWSRDNHNGNGVGGYPNMFNWTIPNIEGNCTLRIRYNISTNDFDHWAVSARHNGQPYTKIDIAQKFNISCLDGKARGYLFKNDPEVRPYPGKEGEKLPVRLAINTAQYGRTFQDRSHMFTVEKRPRYLRGKKIYNVNVRGKRGNIVQVYPAVEYDYVPNVLTVGPEDYVHFQYGYLEIRGLFEEGNSLFGVYKSKSCPIKYPNSTPAEDCNNFRFRHHSFRWTGSDRNPRNNAGEGRQGTDKSNIVLLNNTNNPEGDPDEAYPYGKYGHWGSSYPEQLVETNFLSQSVGDLQLLAFVDPGVKNRNRNCRIHGHASLLDGAPTYYDHFPRKATTVGTYHYFCTRNNNFSNRSQKGKLIVERRDDNNGVSQDTVVPELCNKGSDADKKQKSSAKDIPNNSKDEKKPSPGFGKVFSLLDEKQKDSSDFIEKSDKVEGLQSQDAWEHDLEERYKQSQYRS